MTEVDYAEQLKDLDAMLRNIEVVLDLPRMREEKAELEAAASEPTLWDDQAQAQQVTSKLSYASAEINKVEQLRGRLDDAGVLLELAEAEDDPASLAEVAPRSSRCARRSRSWRSVPCCPASTTPARRW